MFLAALVNTSMISYRDLREFDVFLPKLPPKTLEKLQMLGQVLASLPLVLSAVAGLAALVGCRGQRFKGLKSGSFNGLV
jgi:hypothetical protein